MSDSSDDNLLQRPKEVDVNRLGPLLARRIAQTGYEDASGDLSADLAFLYAFAIDLIQNVNVLAEFSGGSRERIRRATTQLTVDIEHYQSTFMLDVIGPLGEFKHYLYGR